MEVRQKEVSSSDGALLVVPFAHFRIETAKGPISTNVSIEAQREKKSASSATSVDSHSGRMLSHPRKKSRKISADDADDADEILILRGSLMFHGYLRNSVKSMSA